MMEKLKMEDLILINGGADYDTISDEDLAYFKKNLAYYKGIGMKKETMIELYRQALEEKALPAEQAMLIIDMINTHWDSV